MLLDTSIARSAKKAVVTFAGAAIFTFLFFILLHPPGAAEEEILVFAAASTTDALTEIGKAFSRETGTPVKFAFGSSSMLARQIVSGAAADVFLSADQAKMDDLVKTEMVRAEDVRNLLSNQLVVVVPVESSTSVRSASDLVQFEVIATGDPTSVPVGIYARKWLESENLWADLQPKIVPTLDVRAALAAVETGSADGAIVYKTDASISKKVKVAYSVPVNKAPAIIYPVARLARSGNSAGKFVDYLTGVEARRIFSRFGFLPLGHAAADR